MSLNSPKTDKQREEEEKGKKGRKKEKPTAPVLHLNQKLISNHSNKKQNTEMYMYLQGHLKVSC